MLRTTTCPARHHFRTHGVRHALMSLAFVAGGAAVPLFGAAASQIEPTPTVHVNQALEGPVATHFTPAQVTPVTPATASKTTDTAALGTVTGELVGTGQASFYGRGDGFAGRKTANGETFDPSEMTAAHKTLPLGTRLKVTNAANGKSVVVRVNDRGPYAKGRILDLSFGAAQRLGMVSAGHARVKLEKLG